MGGGWGGLPPPPPPPHTPQILQSDIFRPAAGVTQISVGE
jgi:hypothetical protein